MPDVRLRENLLPEKIRSEDALDSDRISETLSDARAREVCPSEYVLLEGLYSRILRSVSNPRKGSLLSDILDEAGTLILRSVDILGSDCLTIEDLLTASILRSVEVMRDDFLSLDILLETSYSDTLRSAESLCKDCHSNVDLLDPSI
jgi:hypothetical protein